MGTVEEDARPRRQLALRLGPRTVHLQVRVPNKHRSYRGVLWLGHMIYFGCVTVEAHGFYGNAAGMMFCLGLLGLFVGEAEV